MRHARLHVAAAIVLLSRLTAMQTTGFAEEVVLDPLTYGSAEAARADWRNAERTPDVDLAPPNTPGAATHLRLPAAFSSPDVRRAVADRDVDLDLSRFGRFTLEVRTPVPSAFGYLTLYFRSGNGWYGANRPIRGDSWQTLTFHRADFIPEDGPAGWRRITGVRLSAWKAEDEDVDTWFDVRRLTGWSCPYAVVRPAPQGDDDPEADAAREYALITTDLLRRIGLDPDVIDQRDVARDALQGRTIALLPYNPGLTQEELNALVAFVRAGGKLGVFYTLDNPIADALGLRDTAWRQRADRGEFHAIVLAEDAVPGLPERAVQDSWNATIAYPVTEKGRVIGRWSDRRGNVSDTPAIVLGENGFFVGHVLTAPDPEPKAQLLLALVGHFVPEAWEEAARTVLAREPSIGHLPSAREAREFVEAALEARAGAGIAAPLLAAAVDSRQDAHEAFADGRWQEVTRLHEAGLRSLREAYVRSHESRTREGRAVWNHSGTGIIPGDWEASMILLRGMNLNMVVPNMWWAGVAHYDSALLPHSRTFERYGDQIEQCAAAARRHGIEVHPWKVNWNLLNAPGEFVERMRREKRTQVSNTGEPIDWLCPSHPDNFRLELETMLEVVRNYDVDGVHFDYIRYPGRRGCYCDGCRERFEAERGTPVETWPGDVYDGALRPEYVDWRCEQITRLVRETARQARELKPAVKISAAVFGDYPSCRESIGQDWVLWVREGYLDFVCPMDYTTDDDRFARLVGRQVELVGGKVPVYAGIGATASRSHFTDDRIVGQIFLSRQQRADGFVIFNFGAELLDPAAPLTDSPLFACRRAILAQPARSPHAMAP